MCVWPWLITSIALCSTMAGCAQALTCTVQPAIMGTITTQAGHSKQAALPLLVDVPVVFARGGDFVLTCPVRAGDACLVVFAARCIDGWWQSDAVAPAMDARMHDLSDGFALVGPFAATGLTPPASMEDVQLRSLDGKVFIAIKPDQTIEAVNPQVSLTLTPSGDANIKAANAIHLDAPNIIIKGNLTWTGPMGGAGAYSITGDIQLSGQMSSTGDHVAAGISQADHTHGGVESGSANTGGPR